MKKNSQPPSPPEVRFCDLACGRVTVLPTESLERLQAIIQELEQQFHPETPPEHFLVAQAIEARWNGERYRRLLNHAYSQLAAGDDPDSAILETLQTTNNILVKLERSITASDRAFSKAVRELSHLRIAALKAEKQAKTKAAEEWLEAGLRKARNRPLPDHFAPYEPELQLERELALAAGSAPVFPLPDSSSTEKFETKVPGCNPGERRFCGGM
jgi:hypothetical protein